MSEIFLPRECRRTFLNAPWADAGGTELQEIGIFGVPFDLGTFYRTGSRGGPAAIRNTVATRPYNMATKTAPFDLCSIADLGDVTIPMTDKLASDGFVALAPDLYHGELAAHDEMDKAGHLMHSLPPDRAARDLSGAVDFLAQHKAVTSKGIGVIGFCMGGMLSFFIAANRPDKVKAVVSFYGFPQGPPEPDWSKITAPIRGHMAEKDTFFPPKAARALEAKLKAMGKDVTFTIYPDVGHAFMAPHNALGTHNPKLATEIWPKAVSFLRDTVR